MENLRKGFPDWHDIVNKNFEEVNSSLNDCVKQTRGDVTYYVSSSGSDENNGLTESESFRTIQKAINSIPKMLNHNVTIMIAVGNYNENIKIEGFHGGGILGITGKGDTSDGCNVNQISITSCTSCISLAKLNVTTTTASDAGISVKYSTAVNMYLCTDTVSQERSGIWFFNSIGRIEKCAISNKYGAIVSVYGSNVFSFANTGDNNIVGLTANYAGRIGKCNGQPSGTTAENNANGGEIV